MEPFYQDNHNTLYCLDFRKNELPDESVQCVVTSPPYWGLRKYAGEQDLLWGGKADCAHQWNEVNCPTKVGKQGMTETDKWPAVVSNSKPSPTNICSLCGAWKGAYGLEPTPEMYIEHTVEILREVRRVLRKDGVVFWNIGDSYFGGGFGTSPGGTEDFAQRYPKQASNLGTAEHEDRKLLGSLKKSHLILKPKDLCLIPFRVAIAAQEDGWWVRSIIIWSKPNPMPESVTDRPTESHEYILMLTKSGTTQYWTHRDHEGTRTQPKPDYRWIKRISNIRGLKTKGVQELSDQEQHHGQDIAPQTIVGETDIKPEGWTPKNKMGWDRINLWRGHDYYWDADAVREPHTESTLTRVKYGLKHRHPNDVGIGIPPVDTDKMGDRFANPAGRNIRSVWEFPTQPYPEAHFAVFPEKLPELCIKAATPEVGCCSKCGAPWKRILNQQKPKGDGKLKYDSKFSEDATGLTPQGFHRTASIENERSASRQEAIEMFPNDSDAQQRYINQIHDHGGIRRVETLGWQPTCKCNADKVPSIVLDPFAGAGTTGWEAKILNRHCYMYEISREYCQLTVERCRQQVMI